MRPEANNIPNASESWLQNPDPGSLWAALGCSWLPFATLSSELQRSECSYVQRIGRLSGRRRRSKDPGRLGFLSPHFGDQDKMTLKDEKET